LDEIIIEINGQTLTFKAVKLPIKIIIRHREYYIHRSSCGAATISRKKILDKNNFIKQFSN